MTLSRAGDNQWHGGHCDTVLCPATFATELTPTALESRTLAAERGWTTWGSPGRRGSADYCPSCSIARARRGPSLCTHCTGGDLYDYLGHHKEGHRAANGLYRCGVTDRFDLASRNLKALSGKHSLGSVTLDYIRDVMRRDPIDAPDHQTYLREAS